MKIKMPRHLLAACCFVLGVGNAQATPALFDFGINIDGTTSCDWGPCDTDGLTDLSGVGGVDDSGFDFGSGLGSILVTVGGSGAHNVDLYLDHEFGFDFFDEFGDAVGSPGAGQSWEIDEPGFVFGDIFENFLVSALDNFNNVPSGQDDDVSMAIGFDFTLAAGEVATLAFLVSEVSPDGGFVLSHTDPGLQETIYFSASLEIADAGVPVPATLVLMGLGLVGVGYQRRKQIKAAL